MKTMFGASKRKKEQRAVKKALRKRDKTEKQLMDMIGDDPAKLAYVKSRGIEIKGSDAI